MEQSDNKDHVGGTPSSAHPSQALQVARDLELLWGIAVNFGILVFPGVEELDFVGPWEMARMWSLLAGGPENCFIIAESLNPVSCAKGLSVNPAVSITDCPQLDLLLVPGGEGTRREVDNPALLRFIEEQSRGCQAVLSVCTGAFLLHRAGLLSGKKATTHWAWLDRLRALGDVKVVEERFVQDGKIWSSAGVSAGIDLMLAVIASIAGDEVAGKVQFRTEYYPSAKLYGDPHEGVQAPAYLRQGAKIEERKDSHGCPAERSSAIS